TKKRKVASARALDTYVVSIANPIAVLRPVSRLFHCTQRRIERCTEKYPLSLWAASYNVDMTLRVRMISKQFRTHAPRFAIFLGLVLLVFLAPASSAKKE